MMEVAVILVAGGMGTRFGSSVPKQFLPLGGKPVALHSFDLFTTLPEVSEIIVVCAEPYRTLFPIGTHFADPGKRRQDSVYNGLQEVSEAAELVCVHDAARPLVREAEIKHVFRRAHETGAAALGVRVKSTIKRCDDQGQVLETLPREQLWEVQTPQVIRASLLRQAYAAHPENVVATDDLSLIESSGHPIYIVPGNYTNLKITTADDLDLAQKWLHSR